MADNVALSVTTGLTGPGSEAFKLTQLIYTLEIDISFHSQ